MRRHREDLSWFTRLGVPLDAEEQSDIEEIARNAMLRPGAGTIVISSWSEAVKMIDADDRDNRRWDAQEGERERLWAWCADRRTEDDLFRQLNAERAKWNAAIEVAAQAAAARLAIADSRFAREAAAAAHLAVHHSALAHFAAQPAEHPFHLTLNLFHSGRWPLGIDAGQFILY